MAYPVSFVCIHNSGVFCTYFMIDGVQIHPQKGRLPPSKWGVGFRKLHCWCYLFSFKFISSFLQYLFPALAMLCSAITADLDLWYHFLPYPSLFLLLVCVLHFHVWWALLPELNKRLINISNSSTVITVQQWMHITEQQSIQHDGGTAEPLTPLHTECVVSRWTIANLTAWRANNDSKYHTRQLWFIPRHLPCHNCKCTSYLPATM